MSSGLTRKERSSGTIAQNQFYRLPTDSEWKLAIGITNSTASWQESEWVVAPKILDALHSKLFATGIKQDQYRQKPW
jgi:hypothetical protein